MVATTCSRCHSSTIESADDESLAREMASRYWLADPFNAGQNLCETCAATNNVISDVQADVASRTSIRPIDVQFSREDDLVLVSIGAQLKFEIRRRERAVMVTDIETSLARLGLLAV